MCNLTAQQRKTVEEIRRIAKQLGVGSLSQRQFDEYHRHAGVSTAGYQFGSWNEAVKAAGLEPIPPGGVSRRLLTDSQLLEEIVRVHRQLGRRPSERLFAKHGAFSPKPYRDRWGSWTAARARAYEIYGEPEPTS